MALWPVLLLVAVPHPAAAASAPAAGCSEAAVPFPNATAHTGPLLFTGDAIPPDGMTMGRVQTPTGWGNESIYVDGHPEAISVHGDVRARVCVSASSAAAATGGSAVVRVSLPWRRRDYNATQKDVIIRHAVSGQEVQQKRFLPGHSRFMGEIAFQALAGAGEYHIYWLPHNTTCMVGYCGPSVATQYPLLLLTAGNDGRSTSTPAAAAEQEQEPLNALPQAQFLGMQPRRTFGNFTAMEQVTTASEKAAFGGSDSFLLIPADRMQPLRLTNTTAGDFPLGWLGVPAVGDQRGHDVGAVLGSDATIQPQSGEWFALQLGVWARNSSLEVQAVTMHGIANFSCLSLGGNDYSGAPFSKQWYLPAGRVSALWMGVQLPAATTSTTGTTLTGSLGLTLRQGAAASVFNISVPVSISVGAGGKPAVNSGDNEPEKMSRLRWLDSRIGISDRVPAPFMPIDTSNWAHNRTLAILGRTITIGLCGLPVSLSASLGQAPRSSFGRENVDIFSFPDVPDARDAGAPPLQWVWSVAGPRMTNLSQSEVGECEGINFTCQCDLTAKYISLHNDMWCCVQ